VGRKGTQEEIRQLSGCVELATRKEKKTAGGPKPQPRIPVEEGNGRHLRLRSSKGTHKGSPAKSRDNRRDFSGGDAPAKRMRRSRYLERMAGGPEPLPRTPTREGNGRHLQRKAPRKPSGESQNSRDNTEDGAGRSYYSHSEKARKPQSTN